MPLFPPWKHPDHLKKDQVICMTYSGDEIVGTTLNNLIHPWNPNLRIVKASKVQDVPTGGRL